MGLTRDGARGRFAVTDLARVRAVAACFTSADHLEGPAAFMEKRKPNFTRR